MKNMSSFCFLNRVQYYKHAPTILLLSMFMVWMSLFKSVAQNVFLKQRRCSHLQNRQPVRQYIRCHFCLHSPLEVGLG